MNLESVNLKHSTFVKSCLLKYLSKQSSRKINHTIFIGSSNDDAEEVVVADEELSTVANAMEISDAVQATISKRLLPKLEIFIYPN